MQWLRHTRFEPPTVAEQQQDLRRRETIKLLAARADQRWAEKPSALDAPDKQQPIQVLESRDPKSGVVQSNVDVGREEARRRDTAVPLDVPHQAEAAQKQAETASQQTVVPPAQAEAEQTPPAKSQFKKQKARKDPKDSPWNKASQANPGDDWQPKGWSPAPAARKRS
jgi:NADH dehydrogenase [ubiquinone] 1 alpha subcomplex assembly factor 2